MNDIDKTVLIQPGKRSENLDSTVLVQPGARATPAASPPPSSSAPASPNLGQPLPSIDSFAENGLNPLVSSASVILTVSHRLRTLLALSLLHIRRCRPIERGKTSRSPAHEIKTEITIARPT